MGLEFSVDRLIVNGVKYAVKANVNVSNKRTLKLESIKAIPSLKLPRNKTKPPERIVNECGKMVIPKALRDKYMLTNEYVEIHEIIDEQGRKGLALFKVYD